LLLSLLLYAAARGDYNELEQLVAGQLAGLARDASWLKSYLVASLLLGKEAMQVRSQNICVWCYCLRGVQIMFSGSCSVRWKQCGTPP
jgi:hypothetical protein